jgi:hypothetical protein
MAVNLSPVGGAAAQFFDNNGVILSGGKLFTYVAGTTTNQTTYTSSSGSTAHTNPIVLDAAGRVPGGEIWLTDTETYKFVLRTSTDVLIGTYDNVSGISSVTLPISSNNVTYTPAGTGAVATTVQAKLRQTVSVKDFGATGNGATDDTVAINNAITAVRAAGGGEVYFPAGTYLLNGIAGADGTLNGILIPFTSSTSQTGRIFLRGAGRSSILKAGGSTMYVIRLSDSNCGIEHLSIDGNGPNSVTGIGLVPENITNNAVPVFQTFNTIFDVWIQDCYTGIQITSGKPVATVDSGAWYNNFISVQLQYTTRGIWLSGTAGHSPSNNRNGFNNIRIGESVNTGIQIDEGNTNVFNQVHIEGVITGTSPSAIPTAIVIAQTGASGADNNSNTFFGCMLEANTRSLNNANAFSEFYGCEFGAPYTMLLTQNPKVMIGGDPSQTPQFAPGYLFQSNSQIAGVPNNTIWPTSQIRSSNDYFTDYQKLDSVSVGTIVAGGSTTVTIYPAQVADQQVTIQFVVTAQELTAPPPIVLNATDAAVGQILAQWQGGLATNAGLSTVVYAQSQGVADYRVLSTMTVTIGVSSNNLRMTIANTGANEMRQVRIGMIITTS